MLTNAHPRLVLAQNGEQSHEASYLFSHLHHPSMKFSFLCILSPCRKRNKAGREIGPIEGQSEADPAAQPPTESAPDLQVRTGTPTLPIPRLSTSRDQE